MHTKKIKTLQVVPRGGGWADRNTPYGRKFRGLKFMKIFEGISFFSVTQKSILYVYSLKA